MSHKYSITLDLPTQAGPVDYDEPAPDWGDTIPFLGELRPGGTPAIDTGTQRHTDPIPHIVGEALTGHYAHWEWDALAGLLGARGCPMRDAERIAAYIDADRDTIRLHRWAREGTWHGVDFNFAPVYGYTWGLFAPLAIQLPLTLGAEVAA